MCNMNCCMKFKLQTPTSSDVQSDVPDKKNRHMNMCNKLSGMILNVLWANRWSILVTGVL